MKQQGMKDFEPFEEYLGDGVYARFNGYDITLDLRAQPAVTPITKITLEPPVLIKLGLFVDRCMARRSRPTGERGGGADAAG